MITHDLKNVVVNNIHYNYFYIREKNDRNGNPRYRIYIIDPDTVAIYEMIAKTYDGLIKNYVIKFIEGVTA